MVDAFIAPINVTAEYLGRIARGDVPDKITTVEIAHLSDMSLTWIKVKRKRMTWMTGLNGIKKEFRNQESE